MKTHIDYQTIDYNGHPAFVIIPWAEFNKVRPYFEQENDTIPHEVVVANAVNNVPIIKAWREYFGFTQEQLAEKIGIKQPALARLESGKVKPRHSTVIKLSAVFGIKPSLLEE